MKKLDYLTDKFYESSLELLDLFNVFNDKFYVIKTTYESGEFLSLAVEENLFSFKSRWKGNDELIFLPHIKYVHQVQNLHYDLVENLLIIQSIKN